MDRELRSVVIGLAVLFLGTLVVPTVATLLLIPYWIGLLATIIVAIGGLFLLYRSFDRYRWVEVVEFYRTAKDVYLPKGH